MDNIQDSPSPLLQAITTLSILFFINYRLAVYGKEQREQKMWLSLLLGVGVSIFAQFVYNVWDINFKTPLKKWKANLAFAIAFIFGLIIRLQIIFIYAVTFYLTFLYYSS